MTGLLVSVRDDYEAAQALDGGADVIDVKEPARGPLGRADACAVADVVRQVGGRAMVTAAAGDFGELAPKALQEWARGAGAAISKIGFREDQGRRVRRPVAPGTPRCAPVFYADQWRSGQSSVGAMVRLAERMTGGWLVVDTHDKSGGGLFTFWSPSEVAALIDAARARAIRVVLAGSLAGADLPRAIALKPDLVGVRRAVCDGERSGPLNPEAVATVARMVQPA